MSINQTGDFKSEAIWVFAGQAGSAIGILLGVKVITQFLDPFEYGRLSLATTLVNLIGMNFFGPLAQGLMRFWSISQNNNHLAAFNAISKRYIGFLLFLVVTIGIIVFLGFLVIKRNDWAILLVLSVLLGGLTGWSRIRLSILMAARKRKSVALINSGTEFLKPIIAVIFFVIFLSDANYVMVGYLLAMSVSLSVTIYFYKKTFQETLCLTPIVQSSDQHKKELGKEILTFSTPFLVWGWFSWLHQSTDRWALVTYHNTHVVGGFTVLTQLAIYPILFCVNLLSNFFLPIAYDRAGNLASKDSITSGNRIIVLMAAIYFLGASTFIIITSLFHHMLVLLISTDEYARLSYLLPGLTISWALFYFGQMLTGFGLLANRTWMYVPPIIACGIIATGSTFYLTAKMGPSGAVWGLGIAGGVYAFWCLMIAIQILTSKQETSTSNI